MVPLPHMFTSGTTLGSTDARLVEIVTRLGEILSQQMPDELNEIGELEPQFRIYTQLQAVLVKVQAQHLKLAGFKRETGALFLRFYEEQRAREIARSELDHSEKIDRLGQLLFDDLWLGIEGVTDHLYVKTDHEGL